MLVSVLSLDSPPLSSGVISCSCFTVDFVILSKSDINLVYTTSCSLPSVSLSVDSLSTMRDSRDPNESSGKKPLTILIKISFGSSPVPLGSCALYMTMISLLLCHYY